MDTSTVTLAHIVDVWYELACSGVLTRPQLAQLKKLFDGAAQQCDGTLALLRAQTAMANELQGVVEQQTQIIARLKDEMARLTTRLSAAEGRHVDAALLQGITPQRRQN